MRDLYPKRAPNLASRVLGDEAIVMNPADSTLFNLNETAAVIWQNADGKSTLRQIVERDICPAFDVEPGAALAEAEEFASALAVHSILILLEAPDNG